MVLKVIHEHRGILGGDLLCTTKGIPRLTQVTYILEHGTKRLCGSRTKSNNTGGIRYQVSAEDHDKIVDNLKPGHSAEPEYTETTGSTSSSGSGRIAHYVSIGCDLYLGITDVGHRCLEGFDLGNSTSRWADDARYPNPDPHVLSLILEAPHSGLAKFDGCDQVG